ncbi:hypothetical protein M2352_002267 [Azospirillum fermentarium]|uniref:hypothetical protein n=1 Tax=Azospirillum fermentarium TaxID=1233114 RepID=UPI00222704B6|nr:hypothetical protein [Azospirillum fermentarium]MCW2246676.1 hypothetical protein [Azospirillum fermentarium]
MRFRTGLTGLVCAAVLAMGAADTATAADPSLAQLVADIPRHPERVAAALETRSEPAARAWLLYLLRTTGPRGETPKERIAGLEQAILSSEIKNDKYLVEEIKNIGDLTDAPLQGVLLFLRHILSADAQETAPCFLFILHGQAAFEAFGPFWGNGRDQRPRLCEAPQSLYSRAEWRKLAAVIDPAIEPALKERGSIRIGYERQFAVDALQASLVPASLLELPYTPQGRKAADERGRAMAAFRSWSDWSQWPKEQYEAAKRLLPTVIDTTSKYYETAFELSPKFARQAAEAAAERFIASRLVLLTAE